MRLTDLIARPAIWSLLAALCSLAWSDSSALAATGHQFLSSLSEAPPGTALGTPGAVAMDHASGTVFVGDPANGVVDVFSSKGEFQTRFGEGLEPAGLAIDEASGAVYVADPSADAVLVFKPNGSGGYVQFSEWPGKNVPGEEFGEVVGVAVDNSTNAADPGAGDVYVADHESPVTETGAVDVFRPKPSGEEEAAEGQYLRALTGTKLEQPNGVAVNSVSGDVYVADGFKGTVYHFNSAGEFDSKFNGSGSPQGTFRGEEEEEGNVTGMGVDEASGDLLVAESERHVVSEFNSTGQWVGWVTGTPSGAFGEPRGVAVASSGDVYVGDAGAHLIDLFGPGVVVPDVKTTTAAKLTRTSVVLGGAINGDSKVAEYHFEWGESEALGSSTPTQTIPGSSEQKASAALGELKAGTSYFFRLIGENENGRIVGAIHEFTTLPAVEGLSTGPVQNVAPAAVTLTGALTPGGLDAHYYFEWGRTSEYTNSSPEPPGTDAGAGAEPVAATTELAGLAPNTTYHYRLVASNSFGVTEGEDGQFTTSGPPRITNEATTGIGHETATIHAKVNPDELATTYHFEYGETTAYGSEAPLGGQSLGSGSTPIAVSAALSSLKLGVTYHFRVVASNSAGATDQPDQTFTTVPPAAIDSTSASAVSATAATLQTQVNPLGHETTFYFQYGTSSCKADPAGCTNTPAPPGTDIGGGEADQPGSAHLQELRPGTTYYYRVLATNSLGTAEGLERTFTTQPAAEPFALPDNRAWEMVTPPDKQGAPVEALTREGGLILAAEDGSRLAYVADGALGEEVQGNRSPEMQQILATRGPAGWSSQDIATPEARAKGASAGNAPEYQYFSSDLSRALVQPIGASAEPPLAPGVTQNTSYVRDNVTGTYLPVVNEANVLPGTKFGGDTRFTGATAGLSHIVINSSVALTGPTSAPGLYEWTGGHLQFVSALPAGGPAPAPELGYWHIDANAISKDGSRIIWTNSEGGGEHKGHLYMSDTANGQTVQLDAAHGAAEPPEGAAQFQTASGNGSRIFFTDKERLTSDSTAQSTFPAKADLYECEMIEREGKLACQLKDLTVDSNEGESAGVQGFLLGSSEDGSTVYLVAQGVLAENENGNGERAQASRNNLYELQYDGRNWATRFVAVLASEDSVEWEGSHIANAAYLTARVSPNGRYLAFMSSASLTGYDNVDQNGGKRDEEVYLYDSGAAALRCVSCDPSGARPVGVFDTLEAGEGLGLLVDRRKVWQGRWLAGNIPGWTAQSVQSALFQSRYLSDQGRLFFNSPDSLVAQASNGKENVYEYEPAGVGSCESSTGACVTLVSSGSSGRESAFLEATPSGNDVFFLTAAQLLPQDTDTAFDIYDARVCSAASPCLGSQPASGLGCGSADACRAAPPAQQAPIGSSGSASVLTAGNVVAQAKAQGKPGASAPKPLTRAQKLARALHACKKQRSKKKRKACEAHARKLYGANAAKAKKSSHRHAARRARR